MKGKLVLLVVSCLMVLSLLLASCAPAAPTAPTAPAAPVGAEVPQYGGVVTAIPRKIPGYAPVLFHKSQTVTLTLTNESLWGGDWAKGPAGSNEVSFVVFVGQLRLWGPRLATSYEIEEPDTLIFHIRQGVHWALNPDSEASRLVNGREFTAYDAARSLNDWYFDPEGHWQVRVVPEERPLSVEATDKWTVVIKGQPGTLSSLMYMASDFSETHPPEVYDQFDKMRDWRDSVGTGPFMLTDVVEDSSITYVRNPNYWDTDPVGPGKGNQLPYLDGFKFLQIYDKSTQHAALRTAKVDMLIGVGLAALNWEDAEQMQRTTPDLKSFEFLARNPGGISLRIDKPELPWYDIKVRQAMTMALDYDTIIRDYFRGKAELAFPVVPYPEVLPMYTPMEEQNATVREMYSYQPEKAKQILAEAGYPDGFNITIATEQKFVDELTIIQDYLGKIGVDVKIDVKESAVFRSLYTGFKHKEAVYKPLQTLTLFAFHPTNPTDTANSARVDDAYANRMYADSRAAYMFDEASLHQPMKEFEQYVIEQAWYIQFPSSQISHMWWPWVKNYNGEHYVGNSARFYFPKWIWVDQEMKRSMGY